MDMYLKISIADNVESEFRVLTNFKDIYDLASLIPKNINEVDLKLGGIINFLYHDWEVVQNNDGKLCNQYVVKMVN